MLTVHWIKCIRDRGMTIVFDQISSVKGRIINWQLEFIQENQLQVNTKIFSNEKRNIILLFRSMKNKN
jgi:hypothetical protein